MSHSFQEKTQMTSFQNLRAFLQRKLLGKQGVSSDLKYKGVSPRFSQQKILRYLSLITLSLSLGWTMIVHMDIPVLPYDDAFITFRYVKNFLEGNGLVYNLGQRVFGVTSPLYLFWLTLLKFFFPEWAIPHLAVRFNAIHFGAAGLSLYFLLKKYTGNLPVSLLGSLSFLLNPFLLSISSGGMESFLFVTLLTVSLLHMAYKKPIWTGIFSGLSVLTRPEGILLFPVILLVFRNSPKGLFKTFFSFCVIVLPWVVFSWSYFGSPIPLSLIAKIKPIYPLPKGEALKSIIEWMTNWVTGFVPKNHQPMQIILIFGFLIISSMSTLISVRYNSRPGWQGVIFLWLILFFYGIGNPLFFSWYWPNVFSFALVTLLTGFYFLGNFFIKASERVSRWIGGTIWMIGVWWLVYCSLMPILMPIRMNNNKVDATTLFIASDISRWRIIAYEHSAKILNKVGLPTDTVAAPEVGALGFIFKGFIYDACGLVSPEALPFLPVPADQRVGEGVGAISAEFTKQVNPVWVVTMPIFSVKSLSRSDWFIRNYYSFKEVLLPVPVWGDRVVIIYKKRRL